MQTTTTNAPTLGTILGGFSKAVPGAVSINFSVSGGAHCDDSCTLKSSICYAIGQTARKPSIRVNGQRHEDNPEAFVAALTEPQHLKRLCSAPWVRFSAFGAFFRPSTITPRIESGMRQLAAALTAAGRMHLTHFPTETLAKARILRDYGFRPRVSCGTDDTRLPAVLAEGFTASLVVMGNKRAQGRNKRAHCAPAFEKARELRAQGVDAKVCPAIAGNAKCGDCTLCATVPVIIYPGH